MKFKYILIAKMEGSGKQNIVISFDLLQNMRSLFVFLDIWLYVVVVVASVVPEWYENEC